MRGQHPLLDAVPARRVQPGGVAEKRRAPRLVERGPHPDPVTERIVEIEGVFGEQIGGLPHGPSAALLQCLRKIPVIEGEPGADAGGQQLIDESPIEVHSRVVECSAVRAHPCPRGREPIALQPHAFHERHVVAIAMVVVAGDIAVLARDHGARHAGEGIPDRVPSTVQVGRSLDLIGGGRRTEQKRLGERTACRVGGLPLLPGEQGHPFTAPCMIPLTSCLPAKTNRSRRGMVDKSTPASTIE